MRNEHICSSTQTFKITTGRVCVVTLSLSHVWRSQRSLSSSHVCFIWREWSLSCRSAPTTFPSFNGLPFHLPTRLMGFLSSLGAWRSHPAAFHVLQDIRQESQIVLVWMREAHATGSRLQRKVCVPPLAPCQTVNDEHMLVRRVQEFTFMFTAGHLQRRQQRTFWVQN